MKKIVTFKSVKFSEIEFKPYQGPSGPTNEQALNNTLFLAKKLLELEIPCTPNYSYYAEITGNPDVLCVEVMNDKQQKVIVDYDRWGYACDELELDQSDLSNTLDAIVSWYKTTND